MAKAKKAATIRTKNNKPNIQCRVKRKKSPKTAAMPAIMAKIGQTMMPKTARLKRKASNHHGGGLPEEGGLYIVLSHSVYNIELVHS